MFSRVKDDGILICGFTKSQLVTTVRRVNSYMGCKRMQGRDVELLIPFVARFMSLSVQINKGEYTGVAFYEATEMLQIYAVKMTEEWNMVMRNYKSVITTLEFDRLIKKNDKVYNQFRLRNIHSHSIFLFGEQE